MQLALKAIANAARHPAGAATTERISQGLAVLGLPIGGAGVLYAFQFRDTQFLLYALLFGAALVVAAAWLATFANLADLAAQRGRDLMASEVFASLQRNLPTPHPYTLYLRPFVSTNAIQEDVLAPISFGVAGGLFLTSFTHFELEEQIERATRRFGPLVALGRHLEHIGAGRIEVDENRWMEAVSLLSRDADLIVLLPSTRPGTLWEVDKILDSNLIERTVFIDPPGIGKGGRRYDKSAEWTNVRKAFADRGFKLPEDRRIGQLLYFGDEKTPKFSARLDVDAEDNIEKFFKRVLKHQRRLARANGREKRA